jgi:tetratricopeptide (TPR) repeat protein
VYAGAEFYGPSPARSAIEVLRRELAEPQDLVRQARIRYPLAGLYAVIGNIEAAREQITRCIGRFEEVGFRMRALRAVEMVAWVELIAGSPARAEDALRRSIEELRAIGNLNNTGGQIAILSVAVGLQGHPEEALRLSDEAQAITAPDDVFNWLCLARARGLALRLAGRQAEAISHLERGLSLAMSTDSLMWIGDLNLERARVLRALDRTLEAVDAVDSAADAYRRKEHLVGLAATEAFRRELTGSPV